MELIGLTELVSLFATVVTSATPLLLAASGELVTERAGVLNLGVEGMMLMGAIMGLVGALATGNVYLGFVIGALAGALTSMIFAVLTQIFLTNQVATGLALTIFGIGLSGLIGVTYVGIQAPRLDKLSFPILSDIPYLGQAFFKHDFIVYFSIAMVIVITFWLNRTRAGLRLRGVGENHGSAHSLGHSVIKIRFAAIGFGGAMCGIAGAYLPLAYTPHWAENMTAGRGWIALALVVFASWIPSRVLAGAYLFGAITVLQLYGQGAGWKIPSQFLSMMPYVATIAVLVMLSIRARKGGATAPACLGKPFAPNL